MKKYSYLLALSLGVLVATAQEAETKAGASNYRTWSIDLSVANTMTFGDLTSFQKDKDDKLDGGGFQFGGGLSVTKFFNPTIGARLNGGYYTTSGTGVVKNVKSYSGPAEFEGNFMQGSLDILVNVSNIAMRGKTNDRKNAFLVGAGLGFMSHKGKLYDINGNLLTENGLVDKYGRPSSSENSSQFYLPLTAEYKRKLSNAWDFNFGGRYIFTNTDWFDVSQQGSSNDQAFQLYLGVSYNFGAKEKGSIIYTNPLDDMYADMEEVKNNFDQLTTDDDKDGVNNFFDKELNTPEGATVDGSGKAMDVDGDGVPDYMDNDPFTDKGAIVDASGNAVDSDGDGVPDNRDEESNTPKGSFVNFRGMTIVDNIGGAGGGSYMPSVYFDYNSSSVSTANVQRLATIAQMLKANGNAKVIVTGYTDSRGSEEYNKNLGMRRAEAVKKELVQVFGIDESRIETASEGEANPLAKGKNNINRRVDITVK